MRVRRVIRGSTQNAWVPETPSTKQSKRIRSHARGRKRFRRRFASRREVSTRSSVSARAEDGDRGRARTFDLMIKSHLLYQLSYAATRELRREYAKCARR